MEQHKHWVTLCMVMCSTLLVLGQQVTLESFYEDILLDTTGPLNTTLISESAVVLPMDYGFRAFKPTALDSNILLSTVEVELWFSLHPLANEAWQHQLNIHRLSYLFEQYPVLKELSIDQFRLKGQCATNENSNPKLFFHGFVLKTTISDDVPDFYDLEALEIIADKDSTVWKVFDRQSNWNQMLVIADLTASMSRYTAQLLLWYQLQQKENTIKYLLFFNDGNQKTTPEKTIGQTGGFYHAVADSLNLIAQIATQTVQNGHGGDLRENDLEALLFGMSKCPHCEDIVLIADNQASPRDLVLSSKIDRPIHVLLCNTSFGINPDYLTLARDSGGSIHTLEEDIASLVAIHEGETIQIGHQLFTIKAGKFVLVSNL